MTNEERPVSDDESNSPFDRIDRRDYLKTTAAAAASGAWMAGGAGAQQHDTITLSPGEHQTYTMVPGETFSNYLIDQTASDCSFTILTPDSGDWTIRNVGWLGKPEGASNAGGNGEDFLVLVVGDASDATIENVYMNGKGDGAPGTYFGAIYLSKYFSGHVDVVNSFVSGFGNNGCYANMPAASDGAGGTIAFQDCYFRDNTPANFRPGASGSSVKNCLSIVNDPNGERGRYYSNDSQYSRAVWHWDALNPVPCENTTVYVDPSDVQPGPGFVARNQHSASGTSVVLDVVDSYVNSDIPTLSLEQEYSGSADVNFTNLTEDPTATVLGNGGVPMSAQAAAEGDRTYPDPFDEGIDGGGGGGGSPEAVAEDFSHADVPGTYDGATGAFTTTSARSTSDSYSLLVDDGSDGDSVILREDMETTAGNTYELDVYHQSSASADMGFLFGSQGSPSGFGDYVGYLGFFESDNDEIRIDRWDDGSQAASSSTPTTWPTDEWLTVELDYRDTDSGTITMTVSDASGSELGSVSLADTAHDGGAIGWYNYWAAADWQADTWFHADERDGGGGGATVVEDFERSDPLADYGGSTGQFGVETSTVYKGSQAITNASSSFGGVASTSGLDDYPSRGDDVHVRFANASDDNFVASLLFAQGESDVPDSYAVGISGYGYWRIWRFENGSATAIAETELSTSDQISGWYRAEISSDSSTIYADLYDDDTDELIASISADDTAYSSGGIGFRSAGNGEVWDYVTR